MATEKQMENIRPHCFKPGQSGNPSGRPKSRVENHLKAILPKSQLKKRFAMTTQEIDEWEQRLLVLTLDELKAISRDDNTPSYAKGLAIAILTDMKNGMSRTISQLRERQYGGVKQKVEVTGANGEPLMQQRELSPREAKAIIDEVMATI